MIHVEHKAQKDYLDILTKGIVYNCNHPNGHYFFALVFKKKYKEHDSIKVEIYQQSALNNDFELEKMKSGDEVYFLDYKNDLKAKITVDSKYYFLNMIEANMQCYWDDGDEFKALFDAVIYARDYAVKHFNIKKL